ADRAASGKNVVDGRSFCDNCGKTLAARDLVPILSWVFAGGKSRCCATPLRWTLLTPEITSLLLAVWAVVTMPLHLMLPTLIIAWLLQAIALLAVPAPRIATVLSMILALFGLGMSYAGLTGDIGTRLLAFALGLLCATVAWTGASDPRARYLQAATFLPAIGALLGVALMAAAILAGIALSLLHNAFFRMIKRPNEETVPPATSLAIGLAGGTWLVWLYGGALLRGLTYGF
ncbi:MAG: prepilin peptidase, partial [Altererythrobacter sp.]|nr:prepilin peptidase [Altererythrobacter sp.]